MVLLLFLLVLFSLEPGSFCGMQVGLDFYGAVSGIQGLHVYAIMPSLDEPILIIQHFLFQSKRELRNRTFRRDFMGGNSSRAYS